MADECWCFFYFDLPAWQYVDWLVDGLIVQEDRLIPARLLQCCALRRTGRDAEQVITSTEQLGESCLSTERSIRCQTSSTLAALAASEASHHLQEGGPHPQGPSDVNAGISEWPDKRRDASKTPTIVSCTYVDDAKNQDWHCSTCILCRRAVRLELNSLPDTVCLCNSTNAFKRHLKTHLFNLP